MLFCDMDHFILKGKGFMHTVKNIRCTACGDEFGGVLNGVFSPRQEYRVTCLNCSTVLKFSNCTGEFVNTPLPQKFARIETTSGDFCQ